MLKNSSAIAVAARMTRVSSAQLLETRRPGPNKHKKVTKFPMAALECVQSYLAGQGSAVCSGGVRRARKQAYDVFRPLPQRLRPQYSVVRPCCPIASLAANRLTK